MHRRRYILLGTAVLLTAALLAFQQPLRNAFTAFTITRTFTPSESDLDTYSRNSPDRTLALWNSQKIVHRLYLASRFRDGVPESILLSAVRTRDPDLQQPALQALLKTNPTRAVQIATSLLADPDPEVKFLALRTLASGGGLADMPHVLPFLRHSDPRLAVAAQSTLLRLDGDPSVELNVLSPPERDAAIAAWETQLHTAGVPLAVSAVPPDPIQTLLPSDFSLTTLDGKPLRLSDAIGKPVLVNFWATWCAPCIAEMPTLVELKSAYGDNLVILSICVDAVAGPMPDDPPLETRVRRLAEKWNTNFPIAIDTTGDTTAAYAAQGVPLTVLIDRSGHIQRRFTGPRSLAEFKDMIDQLP